VIGHPVHRGDVWRAEVPGDKLRPVLVLTRERFVPRLDLLLVAPVTTLVRDIPTEVVLGEAEGLARICAANFDNVFTLSKAHFRQRIGRLDEAKLEEVCRAYRFAAGC
jgi:mRNA interferase MazF